MGVRGWLLLSISKECQPFYAVLDTCSGRCHGTASEASVEAEGREVLCLSTAAGMKKTLQCWSSAAVLSTVGRNLEEVFPAPLPGRMRCGGSDRQTCCHATQEMGQAVFCSELAALLVLLQKKWRRLAPANVSDAITVTGSPDARSSRNLLTTTAATAVHLSSRSNEHALS